MEFLDSNAYWVLGGIILYFVVGIAILRGPDILRGLLHTRLRQQDIIRRRQNLADLAVRKSGIEKRLEDDAPVARTSFGPNNIKQNWRWLLLGFGCTALGVYAFLHPYVLQSLEFTGRLRSMGQVLQFLWSWPVCCASFVFGILCIFSSFWPIDD